MGETLGKKKTGVPVELAVLKCNNVMKFLKSILLSVSIAVLSACGGRQGKTGMTGDTVSLSYAGNITIVRHDGFTEVALKNPWRQGQTLNRYILVPRADSARVPPPADGTVVYTPVERSVVFPSPVCQLMEWLGAEKSVSGVCDAGYVHAPYVRQRLQDGGVVDCGNGMSPSVEKIVALHPQALFVSPFENGSYGSVERLGVPVIECADYMENSALARAEWMKFYGMLVGKESAADSLFAVVEHDYKRLSALAKASRHKVKVITERNYGGVWYCPGGGSSMGRLIADANGQYVFAADGHGGSLPLAPETVISKAADADVWLFVYSGNRPLGTGELLAEYEGYKALAAFRQGEIYECGSDATAYFDEISFRPDWLLRDLVHIFHPKLEVPGTPRYYKKLNR